MAVVLLALSGCGRPIDRPASGAIPGAGLGGAPTGVPPTLAPSEPRFRQLPQPSPGLSAVPSPSPVASPSPNTAPPIVRTIQPQANAQVPVGGPVTVGAVLVGRGADLASANLTVDGVGVAANVDRSNPRQWVVRVDQALSPGEHTARVLVTDTTGARGGFTWRFTVGEPPAEEVAPEEPPAEATPSPSVQPTPPPAEPTPDPTATDAGGETPAPTPPAGSPSPQRP